MTNLYIPIFGLLIALLTNIVFFSKKRIKSKETELYKIMLITSLIDSIILSLIIYLGYINRYSLTLIKILNKIDFIMYLLWMSSLFLYVITIDKTNKLNKIKKVVKTINIIFLILIIIAPVLPYNNNGIMYVSGLSSNILYVSIALYLILIIIYITKNKKNILNTKYIPLYILILIIFIVLIIRKYNPTLIITSAVLAFINIIMYFTIENPDIKLITELENNRTIIENNNEEKSNLLFKLSQEVRVPIKEIENISSNMLSNKNKKELIEDAKNINIESKNITLLIDNILNISTMDINKIKLYKNKFDIYKLYNEIKLITKNNIKKDIKFNTTIINNLPLIYGDSIKLKQIICSILNNSIKNIKEGYIELDIDAITNYDIARLIITIKDNGYFLEIREINEIMSYYSENEINDSDLNLNLKEVNNIIKLLNGTFLIKSKKDSENVYKIIIYHEIDNIKPIKYTNKRPKILLIDNNYNELKEYKKILKLYDIDVTTSMYCNDAINRLRNNEYFDLIILDDELEPYNAIKTLEELKNIPNFKTNIIIMLGLNKEFIKEHYINDYKFKDYIIKRNYKNELKKIVDKYL